MAVFSMTTTVQCQPSHVPKFIHWWLSYIGVYILALTIVLTHGRQISNKPYLLFLFIIYNPVLYPKLHFRIILL